MTSLIPHNYESRILIVDDKIANVQLLEMLLEFAGYKKVHSTTEPLMVRQMCEADQFDLLLLDIRMPEMDGFGVMDAISPLNADNLMPIIVLTAEQDMDTRLKALEMGATDYLTKPFDKSEVLNRINNMLAIRKAYKDSKNAAVILEKKVTDRTLELQDTRLKIIHRLGRAGEYRDNETGMHVLRVGRCSYELARAAGYPEKFAEMLEIASPMHDVGKIGIPDNILLKPGKLDTDEWEIMKSHSQIGADIIGDDPSELLQMARIIALTHHEKWDGTGYPKGLAGERIPIEGRITAICDVFDALTSERPYKKPWTTEKAIALINEQSGFHFDPKLVGLFNEILPKVLNISQKFSDDLEDNPPAD